MSAPKERSILFCGEMVLAILSGRKTQTRRMSESWMRVKAGDRMWVREKFQPIFSDGVRYSETDWVTGKGYAIVYPATDPIHEYIDVNTDKLTDRCKPSIHMPRWASRILLEATEDARREPLQDISEADAIAEGIWGKHIPPEYGMAEFTTYYWGSKNDGTLGGGFDKAVNAYAALWDSLHAKDAPWSSNPSVVRLAFRRVS